MSAPRLTIVGDALLDRDLEGSADRLCPDAPVPVVDDPRATVRPGGAGLAAVLAAADGLRVTLVTALADDEAGRQLAALLARAGVRVVPVPLLGRTAEKVRVRAGGQSVARLDYGGGAASLGAVPADAGRAVADADALLVSDYGRGLSGVAVLRHALAAQTARRPVVWDPHPRGSQPVSGVRLATPNRAEAAGFTGITLDGLPALTEAGRQLVDRWAAAGVAITSGRDGALLVSADGTPLAVPAPEVRVGDACGAGDRFAARAVACLASGSLLSEAVVESVAAASAFVAAGGAGSVDATDTDVRPAERTGDAHALAAAIRARGGTVVATGGCFDLLHAGHVRMLQAARALGDCLIVCLNSDDSVRRLKGPERPLVPAEDRTAVLLGLGCVDAVVTFDEDTPEAILATLRPDVWAKGADYAVAGLPEASLVGSWGGQTVVVPYLDGRSSTALIQEATRRARS